MNIDLKYHTHISRGSINGWNLHFDKALKNKFLVTKNIWLDEFVDGTVIYVEISAETVFVASNKEFNAIINSCNKKLTIDI